MEGAGINILTRFKRTNSHLFNKPKLSKIIKRLLLLDLLFLCVQNKAHFFFLALLAKKLKRLESETEDTPLL